MNESMCGTVEKMWMSCLVSIYCSAILPCTGFTVTTLLLVVFVYFFSSAIKVLSCISAFYKMTNPNPALAVLH